MAYLYDCSASSFLPVWKDKATQVKTTVKIMLLSKWKNACNWTVLFSIDFHTIFSPYYGSQWDLKTNMDTKKISSFVPQTKLVQA